MVKNIFKIYKKITFVLKKIISVYWINQASLILFITQKLFFWVKHNEPLFVQNMFSEFHNAKTETSMSCKKRFDKKCPTF